MSMFISKVQSRRRRGFTLTELAIVLLAASAVITTVWVVGQAVWDNYRAYRTLQQITAVTTNTRNYYGTIIQTWPVAAGTSIEATLDGLGLFPMEMRRNPSGGAGGPIDHPMNNDNTSGTTLGSLDVLAENDPNTGALNAFRIQLFGLTKGPCAKLLMTLPLLDQTIGIVKVSAPNCGTGCTATILNGTSATLPMTPALAKTWCSKTDNTNEVDVDFKLHN